MSDVPDTNAPTPFTLEVIHLIKLIPRGRVATYGQIADLAGRPWASRGVSMVLHARGRIDSLPWHRVVGVGGKIKFGVGSKQFVLQQSLLRNEGVRVVNGFVDLVKCKWRKKPSASKTRSQPKMFS